LKKYWRPFENYEFMPPFDKMARYTWLFRGNNFAASLTNLDGGATEMSEIKDPFNGTNTTLRIITLADLKSILEDHTKWLESGGKKGARANLHSTNLYEVQLKGCNLAYANLQEAYLMGTEFDDACLIGANLEDSWACNASFDRAQLKGANFKGVDLTAAAFINADLTEANFENTICAGGFFQGANLKGANFKKADLHYAEYPGANFEGTEFQEADFLGSINYGEENLSIEDLCKAKSLFDAKLDEEILEKVREVCPHLLDKPI
jgi:uncharacterized protein YjbI with pentapeptide repeats